MRLPTRLTTGGVLLLLSTVLSAAASTAAPAAEPDGPATDGLIVEFRPGTEGDLTRFELPEIEGIRLTPAVPMANDRVLVRTQPADLSRATMADVVHRIAADQRVVSVEPNLRIATPSTADPYYSYQWDLHEDTAGMRVPEAWAQGATGDGVTVAVLDTGITAHPDLDGNVVGGYDFVSSAAAARDGDGRDANPGDEGDWTTFGQCDKGRPGRPSSWHGTHVAGTVAAVADNKVGVTGVAPHASLVPVRVLGACGGTVADISDAIVWASGGAVPGVPKNPNPAQVLNLSLGGTHACPKAYAAALKSATGRGATVVIAAGNENQPASLSTPANCGGDTIVVGALNRSGGRADYSNYGDTVDVAAPGGETQNAAADGVLSTWNQGQTALGEAGYGYMEGTSMATPHVAGLAALLLGLDGTLAPADLKSIVQATARDLPGDCPDGCGTGLADAGAAVRFLLHA
ncbi:S8 family peptidase [Longispora sp. K20-0274]|uniref:S8 family peptidase n=1 Tax=Longispora sp. K20-0274 TaxID=3088255 RepID=UPI00399A4431